MEQIKCRYCKKVIVPGSPSFIMGGLGEGGNFFCNGNCFSYFKWKNYDDNYWKYQEELKKKYPKKED